LYPILRLVLASHYLPAMHKNVETLIGRLATSRSLQKRFARNPIETLREQGLELTEVEIEALAAVDPRAFAILTEALDSRLCKATLAEDDPQFQTQEKNS
jgi:hypothetical protein